MIEFLSEMPDVLFKYVTSKFYKKFFAKGQFQLCTHLTYRNAYESLGAGYGDPQDGDMAMSFLQQGTVVPIVNKVVGKHDGYIINDILNSYILSFSTEYSTESHERWARRKHCGYDICIKIDSEHFLELFSKRLVAKFGSGKILAGRPFYHQGMVKNEKRNYSSYRAHFAKSREFEWEKEYRVVYLSNRSTDPKQQRIINDEPQLVSSFLHKYSICNSILNEAHSMTTEVESVLPTADEVQARQMIQYFHYLPKVAKKDD